MRAMNSRWFLVQVTTSKRVIMENEREKELREELKKIQDSKPRGDSLLKLIRGLQRLQALGPPASPARSLSMEREEVARLVAKYVGPATSASLSQQGALVLRHGGVQLGIAVQPNVIRCSHCCSVFPHGDDTSPWKYHMESTGHRMSEQVFVLRPGRL